MRDAQGRFMKQSNQPEKFKLPTKWYVIFPDKAAFNLTNRSLASYVPGFSGWIGWPKGSGCINRSTTNYWLRVNGNHDGYTEITWEQFKTHVLKQEEFKLPKVWCLALTEENRDVISKWRTCGNLGNITGYILSQGHPRAFSKEHKGFHVSKKPADTPEITFEQFKKYVLKEKEEFPTKWRIQKKYQEVVDWLNKVHPMGNYDMPGRRDAWAHCDKNLDGELLAEVPRKGYTEITIEQFRKHVMCLDTPPENWCIRLNTREIADAVNSVNWWKCGKLQWHDSVPYNVSYIDSNREYHSGIGTPPSGFTEITIEQFRKHVLNQKEMKDKKLVGYNFKPSMKQYEPAALAIARIPHWNTTIVPHVTSSGCIELLRKAAVLDMWFDPVYEDEAPNVEIKGYKAVFTGTNVTFGCKTFTKAEVLSLVSILDSAGFVIKDWHAEVLAVASYLKKK